MGMPYTVSTASSGTVRILTGMIPPKLAELFARQGLAVREQNRQQSEDRKSPRK